VASIAAGNRPAGTVMIVVGTGERSASAWIAPARPVSGQDRGMDPAGQFPQLGQCLAGFLAGRLDQRLQLRVCRGAVAGHRQGQAQRHQPLLRAVMQVTLQPAPLGIPGLDDPGPGGTDLFELGLHLGLQAGMLQPDREADPHDRDRRPPGPAAGRSSVPDDQG
jgi:hypothetical protein